MENPVGPILRMGEDVDLVIDAIREDNPNSYVEVIDRGAYVRVQADNYLKVTEATLQRHLGPAFQIHSLEQMLTAFAGRIKTASDQIEWHLASHPAGRDHG
jgi:toluene monooxygenase system protein D